MTNLPGPYEVTLTKSYSYDDFNGECVRGAIVKIDSNGNEQLLRETEVGVYQTFDSNFTGQIGETYKLLIETPDGDIYESEPEKLNEPVVIDDVYFEYEYKSETDTRGMQVYLDVENNNRMARYFAWEYDETWKFEVHFQKFLDNTKARCFTKQKSNEMLLANTANTLGGQFKRYPLYYISYNTDRLRIRYSSIISQYTISERIYNYLNQLKQYNEEVGTLYDAPPASLVGNVHNINDLDEPVLGIFQVSGAHTKRFFIDQKDVPDVSLVEYGFKDFKTTRVFLNQPDTDYLLDSLLRYYWIILDTVLLDSSVNLATDAKYWDCTLSVTLEEPDFWDEYKP